MNAETPSSLFADKPIEPSPNRLGRKLGSRNKFAQRYVEDFYQAWEEQGISALRRAAFHDPVAFISVGQRILPQKIEHSHPTDGLTDERLAFLIDYALDMARVLQEKRDGTLIDVTPRLIHEKADSASMPEEGGGGPERVGFAAGEGCPSSIPERRGDNQVEVPNMLSDAPTHSDEMPNMLSDAPAPDTFSPPYPVGRSCPEADHVVERRNIRKLLADEDDIDPASLF